MAKKQGWGEGTGAGNVVGNVAFAPPSQFSSGGPPARAPQTFLGAGWPPPSPAPCAHSSHRGRPTPPPAPPAKAGSRRVW